MRDWINPLLVACLVVLGAAVFVLERRISALELDLSAGARQQFSSVAVPAGGRFTAPSQETWRPERRPSGRINGIPYYYLPLARTDQTAVQSAAE